MGIFEKVIFEELILIIIHTLKSKIILILLLQIVRELLDLQYLQ